MLDRVRNYLVWRLVLRNPPLHRALNRFRGPDREEAVTIFGTRLWIHRRKEFGYYRAARLAARSVVLQREGASLITLAMIMCAEDTFVDIGANVGLYAAQFARLQSIYPGLKVYAFEANPDTAERLRRSLAGTGATVHATPLSDRSETLHFVGGAASLVFGVEGHRNSFQIPTRVMSLEAHRLDSFPIEGDSLVLKIDVEGHESEVLRGASGFFDAHRVKAVYLDGFEDPAIPGWLKDLGYELFHGRDLVRDATPGSLIALRR